MRRAGAARFVLRARSSLPTLIVGGARLPEFPRATSFFGGVDGTLGVVALLIRGQLGVRVQHVRTILSWRLPSGLSSFALTCTVDKMFLRLSARDRC
jgi:hypothetical protein